MDIREMVYNRQYNELYNYLRTEINNRKLSRLEMNILRMLNNYFKIQHGKEIINDDYYTANERDYFARVFESLRKQDYDNTKYYLEQTIDRANDPEEFETYYFLVLDILEEKNIQKGKKQIKELNIKLKNKLDTITNVTPNDLKELEDIIYKKIEISNYYGINTWYDEIFINIIETIRTTLNTIISKDYFKEIKEGNTKEEIVINALNNGDYITAFKYISKVDYRTELPNLDYYYMLYIKKLLFILNKNLYKQKNIKDNKDMEFIDAIITYLYFEKCDENIEETEKLYNDKDKLYQILEEDFKSDILKLRLL